MKILQVHNYYQYSGGEDVVLKNEFDLLTSYGNEVIQYTKTNKEINDYSLIQKANLFFEISYSKQTYRDVSDLIKRHRPDICHVHNIIPLISPSVYYACSDNDVPVIQTLHNYRLLCSNAYLFRNGKICEECIGKRLYNSVKYGCYRNSKLQTFLLAKILENNKKWETWNTKIDKYIVITEFAKNKFIEGGLPKDKLTVKPNFLFKDPGFRYEIQENFLFMGRLDVTKGIHILLAALKDINKNIKILVAGDGPLKSEIENVKEIKYLGFHPIDDLIKIIQSSIALIFPSIWYECFPMSILEAFACGKPVIASNIGAMAELIQDGKTGLLFELGNSYDLAQKINWAFTHKEEMRWMGMNARKEYEEKYTPEKNYKILIDIYEDAIRNRGKKY